MVRIVKITTKDNSFLLSPQIDFVFRVLFGSENTTHLLSSLVSSITGEPVPDITLMNPFLMRNYPKEKEGILDVKLKTSKGHQFFIEMQAKSCSVFTERMLFYWAKLHASQPVKGQDYKNLRKTKGIALLGGDWFKSEYQVSSYQILEKERRSRLCPNFELIFTELRNTNIPKGHIYSKDLYAWIQFLGAKTEEEMIMAAEASEPVASAYKTLKAMSQNEEVRELSEAREQWLFDQALRENAAREEGIAEGRIEGIFEGRQEAIREMVQRIHKSGFTLEEIARITTLPEEDIKKIIPQ